MVYSIKNGLVEQEGYPIDPETLFRLRKFVADDQGSETALVISRRAAELKFRFSHEPVPSFSVYFREIKLTSDQINASIEYGYFIADGARVYFVSDRLRDLSVSAHSMLSLPILLKLLRQLHSEGLIDELPSSLIEKLRKQRQKVSQHQKLFIRELYPYQIEGVKWLTFCVSNGVGTILADDQTYRQFIPVIRNNVACD